MMEVTSFIVKHIAVVLPAAVGVSTLIGKHWFDKSLQKHKQAFEKDIKESDANNAKKIKELDNKHAASMKALDEKHALEMKRTQRFFSISQSTFEKLFDKKLNVYNRLLMVSLEFKKFNSENGFNEVFEYQFDSCLNYVNILKKEIEDNRLYLSDSLVNDFNFWYVKAAPFYLRLDTIEINIRRNNSDNEHIGTIISEAQEEEIREMLIETNDALNNIFNQIEADASAFRKSMHII
ncbi:hypothetical protein [Vibrio splendidus]|uniref:hypothetical protein n=2 Tax=Vibrio splendidus TaxID=29497 RepID=UPI001ABFC939|nr:hypothetical protein [Vibrio splendidus]